jgi:hypothetical protein
MKCDVKQVDKKLQRMAATNLSALKSNKKKMGKKAITESDYMLV